MNMIAGETIEDMFMPFLQQVISVTFKGKVIKTGRLLLVNLKNNYITLILSDPGTSSTNIKNYEIPYAFDYTVNDDKTQIVLSYKYTCLCNNNLDILSDVDNIIAKSQKKHRFLDNYITINTVAVN